MWGAPRHWGCGSHPLPCHPDPPTGSVTAWPVHAHSSTTCRDQGAGAQEPICTELLGEWISKLRPAKPPLPRAQLLGEQPQPKGAPSLPGYPVTQEVHFPGVGLDPQRWLRDPGFRGD